MRPFHTISVPHRDILEGKLSMDVYAANLWEVYKNRGPEEYRIPDTFFQKTYFTSGFSKLMQIVKNRLEGNGGDTIHFFSATSPKLFIIKKPTEHLKQNEKLEIARYSVPIEQIKEKGEKNE